jgi:hypothetical protein
MSLCERIPNALYQCFVAYNETHKPTLEKALLVGEAISNLANVNVQSCAHLFFFSSAECGNGL